MPPKTVICSICGEEVMKAKTYCVDAKSGQRACKTHEGVSEKKDKLQENQVKAKEREKKRAEEKSHRRHEPPPTKRTCFCCRKEGLHEQDWNMRFVVAREKVVQKHGEQYDQFAAMFTDDKERQEEAARLLRKEFNAGEDPEKLRKLHLIADNPDDPKFKKLFRNTHRDAKMAVKLTGVTMVCGECLAKHGIKIEMPEIINGENFDKMMMLGAIIKDSIADIARKEIREEVERN